MGIFVKGCKRDKFELDNTVKLSFTNLWSLHSNFVECKSFLKLNSCDILAVCETNLNDSNDSSNFSVTGYLSLIWKDSVTHMHSLEGNMKEGLPFAQKLSLQNSVDSLCFRLGLLHSVPKFLFLCWSPSASLYAVFDSISCNIYEVLSITKSVNFFFFGDFNVHHKEWLSNSGGTDRPGELCYNLISSDLMQMVNFPTRICDCDSYSPALSDFLSSDASIYSAMVFSPLGNSDWMVVSVSIYFSSNSKWDALFHEVAYNYACADFDDLSDYLRDVRLEDIFKFSASTAAREYLSDYRLELMYISLIISIISTLTHLPLFSTDYSVAMIHRYELFVPRE